MLWFGLSIPVAFIAGSVWAALVWPLRVPFQIVAQRWKPDGADELLGS